MNAVRSAILATVLLLVLHDCLYIYSVRYIPKFLVHVILEAKCGWQVRCNTNQRAARRTPHGVL